MTLGSKQISALVAVLWLASTPGFAQDKTDTNEKPSPPDKTQAEVATLTVKGSLPEMAAQPGLFGEMEPNLADLQRRLRTAAEDEGLRAVVLRIRSPQVGRGKMGEIRDSIRQLRSSGKQVIAHLDTATSSDYLLAAACDRIVMPESGMLMIPGVRAEVTFYRGLFDKLGVSADMLQVGDFKGAAEPYTRREMSPEFRRQYQSLIDDFYDQMVNMIAADRQLDAARVRELIDTGVFTIEEAQQAGLVDRVAYEDQLEADLLEAFAVDEIDWKREYAKKKVDNDFSGMLGMMKLFEMLSGTNSARRGSSGKKIAVIYLSGMIMPGRSAAGFVGVNVAGSDTMIKAIRQANDDDKVVAIVLRVNSPGGSSLASDLIWRAIGECNKPTVASMGDTAASGGYYVTMSCDQVFAEPGTLTGSIGVVSGKFALDGLYEKVGVTTETISRGRNSGILSLEKRFSESERAAMEKTMRSVYSQFVRKAAAGRGVAEAEIEKVAGGRLWSGRQAAENGLVDKLGTMADAIAAAKQLAELPADEKVELLELPRPTSLFDQLLLGDVQSPAIQDRGGLPTRIQRSLEAVRHLSRLSQEPALLLMPHQVEIR